MQMVYRYTYCVVRTPSVRKVRTVKAIDSFEAVGGARRHRSGLQKGLQRSISKGCCCWTMLLKYML